MDWVMDLAAVVFGFVIRLGVPIALTVGLVYFLRRLDERWQADVEEQTDLIAENVGCWEINNCPKYQREKCKAYAQPDRPCWQVFRSSNGQLQERCVGCDVFQNAPLPFPV